MLVTTSVFYISVACLAVILFGTAYYISKYRHNKLVAGILVVLGIATVLSKMFFPTVYTVKGCNLYTSKVMLVPISSGGFTLSYGKHCYVVNEASQTLYIETHIYGNVSKKTMEEDNIEMEIVPAQTAVVNTVDIDYIFKSAPSTIRTKSSSEIKYRLFCESNTETEE